MNTVKIKNIEIGAGMPKICVPIVAISKADILKEAEYIKTIKADIVEWRADWFENVFDIEKVKEVLSDLSNILGDIPLLFTFRTKKEGGEKEIELEFYAELNIAAANTDFVDMIDVEIFSGDDIVSNIIEAVHLAGKKIIASNHDFFATPDKNDIISRLVKMQNMSADISKIAVMPNSKKDVLTLLAATEEMVSEHATTPVVTMSMGGKGLISRLSGEVFGSAITFGAAKKASAPGQIAVAELYNVLDTIHQSM